MKNLLLGVLQTRKSLKESNERNAQVLNELYNVVANPGSVFHDFTMVTTTGYAYEVSWVNHDVCNVTNLSTGESKGIVRSEITEGSMIDEYASWSDVISSLTDSSNLNEFISDICSTFATQSYITITQAQAIAAKYTSDMTNNDINNLISYLGSVGDNFTSSQFLNVLNQLYKNVKESYEDVESGDANTFELDTTSVYVKTFVGVSILSAIGSIIQLVAFVLPKIYAVIAFIVGGLFNLLAGIFNVQVKDTFTIHNNVENDFFNTPIIACNYFGSKEEITACNDLQGHAIKYAWGSGGYTNVNIFSFAAVRFAIIRQSWMNINGQQELLPLVTPSAIYPSAGLSSNNEAFRLIDQEKLVGILNNDNYQYDHLSLLSLSDAELASIYCFSLWSWLVMQLQNPLDDNTLSKILVYCPIGASSGLNDVLSGNSFNEKFQNMLTGLTYLVNATLNYGNANPNFDTCLNCIKFIASCYAFCMNELFYTKVADSVNHRSWWDQETHGLSIDTLYSQKSTWNVDYFYNATIPTNGTTYLSSGYGVWCISSIFNFLDSSREYNLNGESKQQERIIADGVPGDRTFEVPEYTSNALTNTLIVVALATVALAVSAYAANRAIRKFSVRKQIESTQNLNRLRYQYLTEPTDANFDAYYKASRKYNLFSKVLGWGTYDVVSGRYYSSSVGAQYTSNEIGEINENVTSVIKLIKG